MVSENKEYSFISFILFIILIDQTSKYIVLSNSSNTLELLSFLELTLITNTGASFGIFQNSNYILALLGILIILIFVYIYSNTSEVYSKLSISMIIAGGIGNTLDRLLNGYVIDFINFSFWPAFNIADTFITIGAMILIFTYFNPLKSTN